MPPRKVDNDWAKLAQSPRAQRVLRFLRRKPLPARLLGETAEGDDLPVVIGKAGAKHRAWTDATRVLLDAVKITAYDSEGNITRVLEHDPEDPTLVAEAELEQSRRGAQSGAISVPLISLDVPRLVDNIASNLREVASAAAAQQSNAYAAGFAAMANVVNVCLSILVRVEERLQNAEEDARDAQAVAAQALPDPPGREQLAMAALQRALGSGGIPNGGAQMDPTQLAAFLQTVTRATAADPGVPPNGS